MEADSEIIIADLQRRCTYAEKCMHSVAAELDRLILRAEQGSQWRPQAESAGHLKRVITNTLMGIRQGLSTNAKRVAGKEPIL